MLDAARYWDEQAEKFDEAPDHGLRNTAVRAAWGSLLLPRLPAAPSRIVDLGCGTGSLSVLLAEAGYQVRGLDLAPRMIALARSKAATTGVDVDFAVGDAMVPPWTPGAFDVVVARHVLWALPDPRVGLDRWLELLTPRGIMLLVEGRWSTGAGLRAAEVLAMFHARGRSATVEVLDGPELWGGPVTDERYLLESPLPIS